MRTRLRRTAKQEKKLQACAVFLCLDYLKTILPPERIAVISREITQEFAPFKNKSYRKKRLGQFQTQNVALILERIAVPGSDCYEEFFGQPRTAALRLNARIIGKLDRHPLKHIIS